MAKPISENFSKKEIQKYNFPFQSFIVDGFLENKENVDLLRREVFLLLDSTAKKRKRDDLSIRKQSFDLKAIDEYETIKKFRELVYSEEMISFIEKECSLCLERNKIDLFCQAYSKGDYLLCHDDMVEQRAVAFILYLVSDWSIDDGGTLDLYNTDEDLDPDKIVRQIMPKTNRLVCFKVSPVSFHQVSEIKMKKTNIPRTSIIGWYHHKKEIIPQSIESPLMDFYNQPNNIKKLSKTFSINQRPIVLESFLSNNFHATLKSFLGQATWKQTTHPANQGRFSVLELNDDSPAWQLLLFFEGSSFKNFIGRLTNIKVGKTIARISRRYFKGDYEIYSANRRKYNGISVTLIIKEGIVTGGGFGFMKKEKNTVYEHTHYIPEDNTVVLSLCEEGQTVRYLQNTSKGCIYSIGMVYGFHGCI